MHKYTILTSGSYGIFLLLNI